MASTAVKTKRLHTLEEIRAAGRALGAARVLTEAENELIAEIFMPVRDQVLANMRRPHDPAATARRTS